MEYSGPKIKRPPSRAPPERRLNWWRAVDYAVRMAKGYGHPGFHAPTAP
jgi:hypothetical protein